MISNTLNPIDQLDSDANRLKKLGNRIKTLRMKAGHLNYEQFAFQNDIGRMQLRRCELGQNVRFTTLLKILKALDVSLADFFKEGFD